MSYFIAIGSQRESSFCHEEFPFEFIVVYNMQQLIYSWVLLISDKLCKTTLSGAIDFVFQKTEHPKHSFGFGALRG